MFGEYSYDFFKFEWIINAALEALFGEPYMEFHEFKYNYKWRKK